ncbi:MAG: acyl-CoA dehydrogenase, partial [Gammaproteobacteria bacterium]|nr:acyl-CoA dehydrogenase [Gammaproteobacteria bacterium]
MSALTTLILYIAVATVLAYHKAKLRTAAIACAALLVVYLAVGSGSRIILLLLLVTAAVLTALSFEKFRRNAITRPLFKLYRRALPALSETEREALDAGTVWWDGELFTGDPDWDKLLKMGKPRLAPEEQAFLDGPVEELCRMVDAWKLSHVWAEIPPHIMQFIKRHGFLGLIIPKEYGGLDLSAVAQSEVLTKVLSVGSVVGNFIMVPNSLGPGELLMKYGTEEQKNHYLPRLANGEEIPCFALTGPLAGSDATSIPDTGIVCRGMWDGKEIIGMRLNFEKRYITLAPIATLVGLAFRLQDPDHLIGSVDDHGITCALIPREVPGMDIGRRHLPVGDPFYNGPVRGRDVFVPLDFIIGGRDMAGKGWRMLVNCLSAGRAISLPSGANSLAKRSVAGAGAYARIRRQFKIPISQFEGIQKPLARIAGFAHIIHAARLHTAQAVAAGSKPSVPSAILKYHCTEMARQVINDAFDIHGGKAVMRGPRNYLAPGYESIPVAITVEGANIMTRSLMIFGQGAIRSHPYVLKEMELAQREDSPDTLAEFDRTLFAHAGFTCTNAARAFWHGLTRSAFAPAPSSANDQLRRWYREVNRLSAAFALVADSAMLTMQASLKRREMISGRLGDLLSMIYLASMVLKNHEDEQCPEEDLPLVEWSCRYLLHAYQEAMHEVLQNLPNRPAAFVLRLVVFPTGRHYRKPSDRLDSTVAALITRATAARRRLIAGIYLTPMDNNPLGRLNALLEEADGLEPLERKLREAVKADRIPSLLGRELIDAGEKAGVLDASEAKRMREYDARVMDVIHVDEFGRDE